MALPDRLVMLLFWCSLVVAVSVIAAQFRPVVVLPLLAVVIVATWRLVPAPLAATGRQVGAAGAAVLVCAVWLGLNLPLASRYVTVTRDPGFLTLEGIWLSTHANPDIPVGAAAQVQHAVPGLTAATGAYDLVDGTLRVQGAKLLPGMLGLAGWVGGQQAVLVANLVIGALALLAVFTLARRMVSSTTALVPVVALALSMPMVAFSRSAYTEPLTLALVAGGLTMAWSAAETRRPWRYLVAGGMVGATALARIDGAASVIGLVLGIGLTAAAAFTPAARRRQLVAVSLAALGALSMVVLGYVDLRLHSPGYLELLWSQFSALIAALVATVVVVLAVSLPRWLDPVRRWVLRRRRGLSWLAAALVVVVSLVLVTRPAWMTEHHGEPDTAYSALVAALQAIAGVPVDATRSYDEYSLSWQAWYFGWPMVALALAGLAILVRRMVRARDPRLALFVGVVVAPSLLYLWRVSISPDQVWAMRRFLAVTIPGLLLASALTIEALWSRRTAWLRVVAGIAAALVLVYPATTWGPVLRSVEQDGRLGEARAVCDAVGSNPVLYIYAGPSAPPYLATIRTLCDVEVVQTSIPPTTEDLLTVRRAWGDRDVSVVAFAPAALPWPDGVAAPPLRTTAVSVWERTLVSVPENPEHGESTVWVATITADGSLEPAPAG
ncbi:glycosyltransferase family 39 protein [Cellulomonas sp. P5_C6]